MTKINWKRKLTSRKLWVSICGFTSLLVVAMGGTESEAAQASAIIMAGATVVSYIIGEGMADAANNVPEVGATETVKELEMDKQGE